MSLQVLEGGPPEGIYSSCIRIMHNSTSGNEQYGGLNRDLMHASVRAISM